MFYVSISLLVLKQYFALQTDVRSFCFRTMPRAILNDVESKLKRNIKLP